MVLHYESTEVSELLMFLYGPGGALVDVGEAMKRLAEVKDSLDIDVKQNFIDPLQGLCDKDLREIQVSDTLTCYFMSGK